MTDEQGNQQQGGQPDSGLHIDTDWKQQAKAEKERLQEQTQQESEQQGEQGQIPPADFKTLVSTLASQALLYMGAIPDPSTGQRIAHLELAKHHIDLLGILEEKTKGNLEDEEEKMITQTVHELRQYYTQISQQVAQHQAQQAAGQQGGSQGPQPGPGMEQGGPAGGIIDPSS